MTARVLVVDDAVANLKLLHARLTSEYLDVITASDGPEALAKLAECHPDVVLLDVLMPGMDGFEVCRRIKSAPETTHVPVVMVTSLYRPEDRVEALEAGADDFVTKPVDPPAFLARIRSLIRFKVMIDELRLREITARELGLADGDEATILRVDVNDGRVLVVEDREEDVRRIRDAMTPQHRVEFEADAAAAIERAQRDAPDLVMVSLSLEKADGLRICSQLRSMPETRRVPLLAIVDEGDTKAFVRALEIGVNGFLTRPLHGSELLARAHAQMRVKRYRDHLQHNMRASLEKAVRDTLTGLHNRRYMETHLGALVSENLERGKPVSIMMMDVDHFKGVNDSYGHDVGDEVLRELVKRIAANLRDLDLACRYGGEEFVGALAGADSETALRVAERLRHKVQEEPFPVLTEDGELRVTISVGVATTSGPDDSAELLLKRADDALYRAKKEGRNRVAQAD